MRPLKFGDPMRFGWVQVTIASQLGGLNNNQPVWQGYIFTWALWLEYDNAALELIEIK